ncbi:MAG: Lon protease family protein [Rhodocyclaceae bacterium]|jgi:predicted ATP-dependent protease|nr:Lon protease family protein [Rhodocyclaceae bacterium]
MTDPSGLPPERLRQQCEPASFTFQTTAELEDLPEGIEQARADEALRFGLAMRQPGYNVFVMGESGTGRHAIVFRLLKELAATGPVPPDLCYVHNFEDAQRPRLLSLPAGRGSALRTDMQAFVRDLGPAIEAALDSEAHVERIEALQEAHKEREEAALRELGQACAADGVSLMRTPEGFVFAPTRDGQPMSPERFEELPADEKSAIETRVGQWSDRLADLLEEFPGWRNALHESVRRAEREALAPTVAHLTRGLRERYADLDQVQAFLDAVSKDLLDSGNDWGSAAGEEEDVREDDSAARFHRYQVNLLVDHARTEGAPVVYEDNPGFGGLVGRIEHVVHMGNQITHFNMIRAGALHRARGGYLVVDAERLFSQPYAWDGLKRVLRNREIRIEPPAEAQSWNAPATLEPQAVSCDVKVVLIGDRSVFYLLDEHDPDFEELFKIAADFDDELPRTEGNVRYYAHLLAMLGRNAGLLPFDREAVARLVDEGARLAEDSGRLSLYTRKLADLMREADFHARAGTDEVVERRHVDRAIAARARRFGRYPERILESMIEGTTLISTTGERAGQINGLVVVELAGEYFGHPVRITATVRMGEGEIVDIERETELGGAIHSKGVLILTAFLASRYARHQPLSLSASLVFEQSYAQVEGDSASMAELCALLSALAGVPIRQGRAITGSVNQFGEAQVVGGINEKIEGFFDLCALRGLDGSQGVLIPSASVRHLMLREDVVEAVRRGQFNVWPIDDVDQAMALLTGLPAGVPDAKGVLPRGSINYRIAAAVREMASLQRAWEDGDARGRARRGKGAH